MSLAEATEGVRDRLAAAVKKRLIADVPLGVLLSGGVDSAAVLTFATRAAGTPMRTFTLGFEGPSFYDERAAAARMAAPRGRHPPRGRRAPAGGARSWRRCCTITTSRSATRRRCPRTWSRSAARQHVTVVLNGDGGDETFAGYERFRAELIAHRVPAPAARAAARPPCARCRRAARPTARCGGCTASPRSRRCRSWSGRSPGTASSSRRRCAISAATGRSTSGGVLASYRDVLSRAAGASHLSRLLYLNARAYLLDDLLPKMDRMSMAHGLEARSPFLDRELTTYAASLPDAYKRRGAVGKVVLKEALRGPGP